MGCTVLYIDELIVSIQHESERSSIGLVQISESGTTSLKTVCTA